MGWKHTLALKWTRLQNWYLRAPWLAPSPAPRATEPLVVLAIVKGGIAQFYVPKEARGLAVVRLGPGRYKLTFRRTRD